MEYESWYPEIERLISLYWLNKDRLARLQARQKVLVEIINSWELKLAEVKRIPGLTSKFGIVDGSQRKGDYDYAVLMVEYENQVDRIIRQIVITNRKLVGIESRLHKLLEWLAPFEAAMSKLTTEERMFTERKYVYKMSNYQIAQLRNCSEKRVRYLSQKIIAQVAEWFLKKPKSPAQFKTAPLIYARKGCSS